MVRGAGAGGEIKGSYGMAGWIGNEATSPAWHYC